MILWSALLKHTGKLESLYHANVYPGGQICNPFLRHDRPNCNVDNAVGNRAERTNAGFDRANFSGKYNARTTVLRIVQQVSQQIGVMGRLLTARDWPKLFEAQASFALWCLPAAAAAALVSYSTTRLSLALRSRLVDVLQARYMAASPLRVAARSRTPTTASPSTWRSSPRRPPPCSRACSAPPWRSRC